MIISFLLLPNKVLRRLTTSGDPPRLPEAPSIIKKYFATDCRGCLHKKSSVCVFVVVALAGKLRSLDESRSNQVGQTIQYTRFFLSVKRVLLPTPVS